ncbi:MAG: signal peptidase I [Bacilli bacterium]|nr:signal peptidase I [Bacilli bacterium]
MVESDKKIIEYAKAILPYIVIIVLVVIFRSFVITPIKVDGSSMYSTLEDGQILLLKKYDKNIKRFDVVVFYHGNNRLIKRVIGLPGDKVEYKDNKLYINDKHVKEAFLKNNQKTYDFKLKKLGVSKIPKNEYFVLGDNRTNSTDSRIIGLVSKDVIQGKTDFIIFPFNKFGKFN